MSTEKYTNDINSTKEQYRNDSRATNPTDNRFLTGSNGHISDSFQTEPHAKRNEFFIDGFRTRYIF